MRTLARANKLILVGAGGGDPATVLGGAGTDSNPALSAAVDNSFLDFRLKFTGASGTSRGIYLKLTCSGGAGGEALRAKMVNSSDTPADTVNGSHTALEFGATAGNVTGQASAGRFTLSTPGRALGGTCAVIQADLNVPTSGTLANTSFMRFTAMGAGVAAVDTSAFFFTLDGVTANSGKLFRVAAPTTLAASLRVKIGSTTYFLPLYSAAA